MTTPRLSPEDRLRLLRLMLRSRLGDLREQSLIRQGKGMFHVSSMGHEAMAAVGLLLGEDDYTCPYYRDRALVAARGVTEEELALDFFAKQGGTSDGRQMPSHFSHRSLNIWSMPSPVAANLLPACGIAWGMQMDGKNSVTVATCGDAASRQGDFYEAGGFAIEHRLPLLFIVEDNGIGISSVTGEITPKGLGLLKEESWFEVDGSDVEGVHSAARGAIRRLRAGLGPVFMWCRTERISSHSSADDQRKYRPAEEIANLHKRCPIECLRERMVADGELTNEGYEEIRKEIEEEVKRVYRRAEEARDPSAHDLMEEITGPAAKPPALKLELGEKTRLVDAINQTFQAALKESQECVFFGEDIADPKGGVFSLTKGLSSAYPDNVHNSPLAESTILGVACGLGSYGKFPIFEIQFIDFIWPAFNQLVTNLSTLRWRTAGDWSCPTLIYAPYGAYLPGGGLWHSQTNEAAIAHFPGLTVCIPSTPEDAAGLAWTAIHGDDPVVMLIPKHLLWKEQPLPANVTPVPIGRARVRREGNTVTVVTWGNCVELVEAALAEMGDLDAEVIDLRTVSPWDETTVKTSVRKTRRLVVVQEDARHCSVGTSIISAIASDQSFFELLHTAPVLVSKEDVNVGYANNLEFAALPDKGMVQATLREVSGRERTERETVAVEVEPPHDHAQEQMRAAFSGLHEGTPTPPPTPPTREVTLPVPLLGEGITSARVATLLKEPGDEIEEGDALCELETDKALFPVEAPHEGTLIAWEVAEEDEVEVGAPLLKLKTGGALVEGVTEPEADDKPEERPLPPTEGGLPPRIVAQIKNVVPAHMTVLAGWSAIREARRQAKAEMGKAAPSPTALAAWCISRAMERHPIFRCLISGQDTLLPLDQYDFGVAVALPNDALDTAIIPQARGRDWPSFFEAYNEAVLAVRGGRPQSKARTPLILTSMGGFSVRSAQPIVVPPAIATLFLGESFYDPKPDGGGREVVHLDLSFDHRWINGAAGSAFLTDVRRELEEFALPATVAAGK